MGEKVRLISKPAKEEDFKGWCFDLEHEFNFVRTFRAEAEAWLGRIIKEIEATIEKSSREAAALAINEFIDDLWVNPRDVGEICISSLEEPEMEMVINLGEILGVDRMQEEWEGGRAPHWAAHLRELADKLEGK